MELLETQVNCPYCWQSLTILVDPSVSDIDYIEDCQVCCQPIRIQGLVTEEQGVEWLEASRENE